MSRISRLAVVAASAIAVFSCVHPVTQPVAGMPERAPRPETGHTVDLEFTDIDGKSAWLSDLKGSKAYVIAMRDVGCPVSARYAPRVAQFEQAYRDRGVAFLYLNVNDANTIEQIRASELGQHGLKGRYIHDRDARIGKLLGVRSTTEVFVLDGSRRLRYRGAMDDQYGVGWSKGAARNHYLKDALESVLSGNTVAVAVTDAPGCALDFGDAVQTAGPVTYHKQVSRIVQQNCQSCHRAEGIAPFALETYEDVRARRAMIRQMVKTRRMPPWFAHRDVGTFANDRSLSDRDLHTLLRWIDEGTPAGDVADAPAPVKWPGGWQIGAPDAIVKLPEAFKVPAEGTVDYQYLYVKTDFPEDRWIERMELRPGSMRHVHHALVFLEEPGRKMGKDRKPGDPPFQGGANGFFAGYAPGYPGTILPEGSAKKLPKGAWLKFQMHYTTNGIAADDQTELGMVLAKQPPRHEVHTRAVGNFEFVIPPGAPNHEVVAERTFKEGGALLSLFPHMHVRGKAFRMELVTPDGTVKPLLSVPRYDFDWQLLYVPKEPIQIAAGTKLRAIGWFDNSEENPANPDPKAEVKFGEQSWEEMMLGYYDWLPAQAAMQPAATPAAGASR